MRTASTRFPIPMRHQWQAQAGCAGFTLTELLVVIAIVSVLVGLLTLGVRGISSGISRRSAIGTLMGVFDQARAVAVSDGRATYVVFVSAPSGAAPSGTDGVATAMWGRAYAVFEDPALTDATTASNFQPQQRSNWLYLPTGIAFKSAQNGTPASLTDSAPATSDVTKFKVPATGGPVTISLPYVKFDSVGQIVDHNNTPPQVLDPSSTLLRVLLFEGVASSTGVETTTRRNAGTSGANAKYGLDEILLKPMTGRAKYTLDSSNNLAASTN